MCPSSEAKEWTRIGRTTQCVQPTTTTRRWRQEANVYDPATTSTICRSRNSISKIKPHIQNSNINQLYRGWPGGQTDGNRFPPVKKTCRRYQIQRDSITKHTITIATCVCKGINDKSHCNDPTEGKLSPPTTHAPRRDRGRQTLSIL
ncbi:uncharacterized protein [Temnothorax longispinosus]|uniref:uncharacterized protein n=1 Tax=Temnothorax longispinosus TaxID=300112 RepID=UPI003A9A3737